MTKTQNYQLPQWEAQDPVRREDFNQAFAAIDAGVREIMLYRHTLENTAKEWTVDLSEWDLSQFIQINIFLSGRIQNAAGKHVIYFNGVTEGAIFDNYTGDEPGLLIMNTGTPAVEYTDYFCRLELFNHGQSFSAMPTVKFIRVQDALSATNSSNGSGTNQLSFSDIKTMKFVFPSVFQSGFRILITGVPT